MNEFASENDALLQLPRSPTNEVRRNTKKDIITRIKQVCTEHHLPLEESDTTLQRSSKKQLNQLLAKKTEELVEKKMKDQVKASTTVENEGVKEMMAVATLCYGLNTLNRVLDRTANVVLPKVGYELDGFMEKFTDPATQAEVKQILTMLVREHPEMLEHIASPYLRLGLVYIGCVSMSLRKIPINETNGAVRREPPEKVQALRAADGRKQETGQVLP
jgi:hypothetical protein